MPEAPIEHADIKPASERSLLSVAAFFFSFSSVLILGCVALQMHLAGYDFSWADAMLTIGIFCISIVLLLLSILLGVADAIARFRRWRKRMPERGSKRYLVWAWAFNFIQISVLASAAAANIKSDAHKRDLSERLLAARQRGDEIAANELRIEMSFPLIQRELDSLRFALRRYHRDRGEFPPALIPFVKPPLFRGYQTLDLPHDWYGPPIKQNYEWHGDLGGWIEYFPNNSSLLVRDRFSRLDGTPIDPSFITGSRIERYEYSDREFIRYLSNGRHYIAFSGGSDGDDDLTTATRNAYLDTGDPKVLSSFAYDPTNGVQSSGDIFIVDVD